MQHTCFCHVQVLFKVEGYEKVAWEEKRSETTYNNDK